MASQFAPQAATVAPVRRQRLDADALPQDVLAPIMAGAQARGVADALELLGIPAVLLGADGCVLNANRPAFSSFGDVVALHGDHLFARSKADNEALGPFLATALHQVSATEQTSAALTLVGTGGGEQYRLYALVPPRSTRPAAQLLRAIIVLDDGRSSARSAFLAETFAALAHGSSALLPL